MPIFVTGSSGFVGSKLIRELAKRGEQVRALVRSNKDAEPVSGVEYVLGDICDRERLRAAMQGCDRVYHLAACAKNWAADQSIFREVNVEGAKNVQEVAWELKAGRILHTSTIVTLGPTMPGIVGDEEMPRVTSQFFTEYEATKYQAEQEALARCREGYPIVIVNPTRVYGPGRLTEGNSVSKLLLAHARGQLPVLLNRGVNVGNYVHVDDLVRGMILAMEKGRIGERYILGGENASLLQLIQWVNEFNGMAHYQVNFTPKMALAYAGAQEKAAKLLGIYPKITPGWVRTFLANWVYESRKAERELGYSTIPLREGIKQTMEWIKKLP